MGTSHIRGLSSKRNLLGILGSNNNNINNNCNLNCSSNLSRMTKPTTKKRQLLTIQGVRYPCLPSLKHANESLLSLTVQSLTHDPLINPKEYDKEASEILIEGKIYIGMR